MTRTLPKYGLLTDGRRVILLEKKIRNRAEYIFKATLNSLTEEQLDYLINLKKPSFNFSFKEELKNYFNSIETISIEEEIEGERIGQREFIDTFRLEENTAFYLLLEKTFQLLDYFIESADTKNFARDAFEFWQRYYASDPAWSQLPGACRKIAGNANNKQKIIFALETLQSLLGRMMLAKACEDNDFPNISLSTFIVEETHDSRGKISPINYIVAIRNLLDSMRQELVQSVFEEDIYYWWTTPIEDIEDKDDREINQKIWPSPIESFGEVLIELAVCISRFDFAAMKGDPLGELYQKYFAPETRRSLGEFYTPACVAGYILNSMGYTHSLQNKRLIDPACGSGTFLVEAYKRYKIDIGRKVDWAIALKNICEQSRIVGLDIHPFAVVLAQIRFMLEILPEYKKAVEEANLVLKRLPIYRTDSLIDETRVEEGVQTTLKLS